MSDAGAVQEPRRLSGPLILGVLAFPAIFVWFTLRRGYSRDVRIGAFANFALAIVIGLARVYDEGL